LNPEYVTRDFFMSKNLFLDAAYWQERYRSSDTGWDLGAVSPPLKAYIDRLEDRDLRILIPGAGNAYEAEYLVQLGFKHVHVIDLAVDPLVGLKDRYPQFPESHLHVGDFFAFKGEYDLILEQTLFCAIDPRLREDYARKCSALLSDGGQLCGLLFNRTFDAAPPFGGKKEEYELLFAPYFSTVLMEECMNSIPARAGTELFVQLTK
jgi:hypothetical protein